LIFSATVRIIFIAPNGGSAMVGWISALLIGVASLLAPLQAAAEERRWRSILVLDQSDLRGPFYHAVLSELRSSFSPRVTCLCSWL
jgi:hypothetical protein